MPLLNGLNEPQKTAVQHVNGPLLILAGAGSGKTRVMTHRIAHLIDTLHVYPYRILAVTFTNKAAFEMKERVHALLQLQDRSFQPFISTFHALGASILRRHAPLLGLTRDFSIFDTSDQLSLAKKTLVLLGQESTSKLARQHLSFVDSQKNNGLDPNSAMEEAHSYLSEQMAVFYRVYQEQLKKNNAVDFGDLINLPLTLIRSHPELASYYAQRWEFVMVDEFQDTNHPQMELLKLFSQDHQNLAVVGDDDQSIYSWRGASVKHILSFKKLFPAASVVKLEQNYRSTKTIVEAAHNIISFNLERHDKRLWTDNPQGEHINVFYAEDDYCEAQWVCDTISQLHDEGTSYQDIAILYRTNAQSRAFEQACLQERIPYQLVGGLSFFDREEIKDLLAYLKLAINPKSVIDLERVINKPRRGIGKATFAKISLLDQLPMVQGAFDGLEIAFGHDFHHPAYNHPDLELIRSIKGAAKNGLRQFVGVIQNIQAKLTDQVPLSQLLQELVAEIHYDQYLESFDKTQSDSKQRNIEELVNAIAEFQDQLDPIQVLPLGGDNPDAIPTDIEVRTSDVLRLFLEHSALMSNHSSADDNGITMMTVHASKGLEFDTVFIGGLEDELFPLRYRSETEREDSESFQEERRLAYVALTRAKTRLFLSAASRRRTYGEYKHCVPSPFLDDIDPQWINVVSLDPEAPYPSQGSSSQSADQLTKSKQRSQPDFNFDQTLPEVDDSFYSQVNQFDEAPKPKFTSRSTTKRRSRNNSDRLSKGVTIVHPEFGVGKVTDISGSGDDAVLTIFFPLHGNKKIIRRFLRILG